MKKIILLFFLLLTIKILPAQNKSFVGYFRSYEYRNTEGRVIKTYNDSCRVEVETIFRSDGDCIDVKTVVNIHNLNNPKLSDSFSFKTPLVYTSEYDNSYIKVGDNPQYLREENGKLICYPKGYSYADVHKINFRGGRNYPLH